MFQAALFDMDGTVLDTERMWRDGFVAVARVWKLEGAQAIYPKMVGATVAQLVPWVESWLPGQSAQFLSEWRDEVHRSEARGITLKPGAMALVTGLAAQMPVAVVTSSDRVDAERLLQEAQLWPSLSLLVAAEDVARTKPDPEPYLSAAHRLGVEITHCAVFEDSDTGTRSAVGAGATVVQVPDILPPSAEVRALGHVIADSLRDGAEQIGLVGADFFERNRSEVL